MRARVREYPVPIIAEEGVIVPTRYGEWRIRFIPGEKGPVMLVSPEPGTPVPRACPRTKTCVIPAYEVLTLAHTLLRYAGRRGAVKALVEADLPQWRSLPRYLREALIHYAIPVIALFTGR